MTGEWIYKTVSLFIVFILFYLLYIILSPFLITIAWAMVLSITFYPLFRLILRFVRKPWIASLITLIIILIVIAGPFSYIVGKLVSEITDIYSTLEQKGTSIFGNIQDHPTVSGMLEKIKSYKFFEDMDFQKSLANTLRSLGSNIARHTKEVFKNAVNLVINFVIMCMTIFYFLKDGNNLASYIKRILPFTDAQKEMLAGKVKEMVIAAIYGGVAVGIAQGTLGGLAFMVLGLPSPVFWGTAMTIFSLVPLFGCFIIWGTASIILILSGAYAKGIGLFLYGALIISSVDNIIKPLIIGGKTKLHPLLVFFSVLGGIKFLGFLGFILGPLIAVLCLSVLEIYTVEKSED